MRSTALTVMLGICSLLVSGCAYTIRVPGYTLLPPMPADRFIAGVGKSELTPPPGVPLGGYGPAGRVSRGYWTRLYARAFYFEDDRGRALALVSCELFMLPAGLRAKVLEIVNRTHRLEDGAVIMSATHTHHGPSNYASAPIYNSFGGPLPHFDPHLFDFLAKQIAAAINEAMVDARRSPTARHELVVHRGRAPGIQRNRAIAPFFRNLNAVRQSILKEAATNGATCPDGTPGDCPRYLAVDPTLVVARILRNGAPHGMLTFYAVHPTAMTRDAELYSGDLAGIAMSTLESRGGGVAGFFNGASGDISPDWLLQDRDDVIELARRLAHAVTKLVETPTMERTDSPRIETRWSAVPYNGGCGLIRFADKPVTGAAEIGGAEDGRTIFYNYGWRPEARNGPDAPDVKEPGLDGPLADALESVEADLLARVVRLAKPTRAVSASEFPQRIPVAVASLGDLLTLAAVPTEVTTAAARAMRLAVAPDGRPATVIGLANEYVGYTTTREEYALQQYEGASTLLGPNEADMLSCLLRLAKTVTPAERVAEQTFRAGPKRKHPFGPDTLLVARPRNMVDEDLEPLIPRRLRRLESRVPRFEWSEEKTQDWDTPRRSVTILARRAGASDWTEYDDDRGVNVLTVLADAGPPGREGKRFRRYTALWLPPHTVERSSEFAFRVTTPAGAVVCSESFRIDTTRPGTAPVMAIWPTQCRVP